MLGIRLGIGSIEFVVLIVSWVAMAAAAIALFTLLIQIRRNISGRGSTGVGLRPGSPDEDRYQRAAAKSGLNLSDWIKVRLDQAATSELGE